MVNQGPFVRPEMRERVMQAVEALGYRANVQARSLATGENREIALVHASDLDSEPNSYYSAGLELGALRACAEFGFHLSNHSINQNSAAATERVVALVREGPYKGIILTPPFSDDVGLIEELADQGVAVACISAGPGTRRLAWSVGIDEVGAGRELTDYLIGLGHRRFGYILGIEGHLSAEGRHAGFVEALGQAGIDSAGAVLARGNFTFHSGAACAEQILRAEPRPTALICANDDMAAGATLTAHKMGLQIPGDVSIAGFDDTPVSEIIWPPLTTVHQPIRELGRRAVELVAEALAERDTRAVPKHEQIPHHLVIRDSAAAPSP